MIILRNFSIVNEFLVVLLYNISMQYEIGKKIKELRKEIGLTQKQLAKMINKSETGFASWEQGLSEPSVNDIRLLCFILDVSADYLLGLEDESGTKTKLKNSFNNK